MFSIGALSQKTKVKIPTIRYYEQIGLMPPAERSLSNQRRYDEGSFERLNFIKHARELGFSITSISALLSLHDQNDAPCAQASIIARDQLAHVQSKIQKLNALEKELSRLAEGCDGQQQVRACYVMAALGDHGLCDSDHV